MATPNFRYIGVTDECDECQCCGKPNLKSTVVLAFLDADGNEEEITWYESTCAARALGVKGGGRSVLKSAEAAHYNTLQAAKAARDRLAHYGLPEAGEPDRATVSEAMQRYINQHQGIDMTELVQRTGVGVKAMVLDMMARDRADIATADLLIKGR